MSGKLIVVVGGQFGSEGKGHLCAQLGARMAPNSMVIRTGGPNAGHTVWAKGLEHKLRMLPTPVAVRDDIIVALAAKAVVNTDVLFEELRQFPKARVMIDGAATILTNEHIARETADETMLGLGSTRKGIGAARADRIHRTALTARDLTLLTARGLIGHVADHAEFVNTMGGDVMIEAAQGYGLGLHTNYYPKATSGDCTAIDALADARISPWSWGLQPEVWMAIRPFPIRVAGPSGPLHQETTWADLGLPEERTTVTNKVRRVGMWDSNLVDNAFVENGGEGTKIGLLMLDQVFPSVRGLDSRGLAKLIENDNRLAEGIDELLTMVGHPVHAIGTGPQTMAFADEAGLSKW